MRRLSPRLPSPAMLVALLALFVALGGSAYAVKSAKAPKNSVVTRSIKKGAVTRAKLAPGAVGSAQLAAGSVTGAKVAAGSIGAASLDLSSLNIPKAASYKVRSVSVEKSNFANGDTTQLLARCETGETAIGGGGRTSSHRVYLAESIPFLTKTEQAWAVRVTNISGETLASVQVSASVVCAS